MNSIYKIITYSKIELAKRSKRSDDLVNWAIVGTGPMSKLFCKALTLSKKSKIIAISSRTEQKAKLFSKEFNIPYYYDSLEKMLTNDQIDVVYVATPVKTHYSIVKSCLEKKKNVLVEKPITSNYQEAKILIDIAKLNNVFLMEAMWSKCLPTYEKIKEIITKEKFGELKSIRVDLSKNIPRNKSENKVNSEYDGVMLDYGIYPLAFILDFFEDNVQVDNVLKKVDKYDNDLSWDIILSDKKKNAHITISKEYNGGKTCSFYFNNGIISLPSQFNRTNIIQYYDKNNKILKKEKFNYTIQGLEYEIEEVNNCIKENKNESSKVSHSSTLKCMQVIDYLFLNS